MLRIIPYLCVTAALGWLLSILHVPAGWLIGPLIFGMFYRLKIGELALPSYIFPFAISLIGTNIGLSMGFHLFHEVASYLWPLVICLVIILLGAWCLSLLLARYSTLDPQTALFCCVPGGVSVMLALSQEYKADQRMVAALQSARAIVIVLSIPIFAGLVAGFTGDVGVHTTVTDTASTLAGNGGIAGFTALKVVCVMGVIALALFLAKVVKIPAAPFLYGMLLAFLLNQFVFHIGTLPNTVTGLGQMLLGASIGLTFDRNAIAALKKLGWLSIAILFLFLVLTLIISLIFFWMTPLDYVTCMLGMAPGGAPQMASTAAGLHLDSSIVAATQLVRLLIIFILLPIIIPIVMRKVYGVKKSAAS